MRRLLVSSWRSSEEEPQRLIELLAEPFDVEVAWLLAALLPARDMRARVVEQLGELLLREPERASRQADAWSAARGGMWLAGSRGGGLAFNKRQAGSAASRRFKAAVIASTLLPIQANGYRKLWSAYRSTWCCSSDRRSAADMSGIGRLAEVPCASSK